MSFVPVHSHSRTTSMGELEEHQTWHRQERELELAGQPGLGLIILALAACASPGVAP